MKDFHFAGIQPTGIERNVRKPMTQSATELQTNW